MLNFESVVDSRNIEERIEELESDRQDLLDILEEEETALDDIEPDEDNTDEFEAVKQARQALEEFDKYDNDGGDLKKLVALRDDVGSSEWIDGIGLINEDYWVEYVEEMLKDIGDLPSDIPYYIAIDWEQTAENIRVDYSSVEYDGDTFYFRA